MPIDFSLPAEELPIGCVESHFLDSGSFTLRTKAVEWAAANKVRDFKEYYRTKEFDAYAYEYMDSYADFVKKYKIGIDYYANVDVIPDPVLTYRNQKYLEEKHGLTPVPVVHYGTDLKWLHKYIEEGYDPIGIGGLVGSWGSSGRAAVYRWLDKVFNIACDTPDRCPKVRLHGFGATLYELLVRYPWWAVDSTTWTKIAAYGAIFVPHKRLGKWDFSDRPYSIPISMDSPCKHEKGKHFLTLTPSAKKIVTDWLEHIEIKLGRYDKKTGEVLEYGVMTRHTERRAANLFFFEALRDWLPKYPWPFRSQATRKGFGIKK